MVLKLTSSVIYSMLNVVTTKAYIPLQRKIPGVGGWHWAMPPTPEFCVGDTNMLVSWSQRICISPDANPRSQSVEYRWRWAFWCWPCIFHVYFMYISCCLCIIFRVGYAKISRRKGSFQWNMGLKLHRHIRSSFSLASSMPSRTESNSMLSPNFH